MKLRTLYHLGNWGPLMSWGGSAVLLGVAASVYELGADAVDWTLVIAAGIGVVVLQYVAHPVNDLLDYDVDARANIKGTGRHKVLHSGLATRRELSYLSAGLIAVVVGLMLYVTYSRPLALLFGMVGFFGLWSYNWTPLKLSYYPFSELVVAIPVNIAMVMGISFVAVGQILPLAFALGVVQAFMAMSVHISYFSMDTESDSIGGKTSTVVRFPQCPWCSIYALMGLVSVAALLISGLRIELLVVPSVVFVILAYLAMRMDFVRSTYLLKQGRSSRKPFFRGVMKGVPEKATATWESASHEMRRILVRQTGLTIVNGVALSLVLVAFL